jgi:hypothetical protein
MLTFKCSACKKKIVTDDHLCGQQGECPYCRKVVLAPGTPRDEGAAPKDGPRCPKCGARRKDASTTCAFCGATIGPPKTRRMEIPVQASQGLDKRKVMMLGGIVAVGLLVVLVMNLGGDDAPETAPDELCRRQMLAMLTNAWMAPGGVPQSTGSQFWFDVAQRHNNLAAAKCPAEAVKGRKCDYRGPSKLFTELGENEIVMTCMDKNHPGGTNVMYKSGSTNFYAQGTDDYKKAFDNTKE